MRISSSSLKVFAADKVNLNDYQREVLAKYPDGLDSPGVQLYAYKPYEPARGTA
jgi:hypothetical protein